MSDVRRCGVNDGQVHFVPACAAQCALFQGRCHYWEPHKSIYTFSTGVQTAMPPSPQVFKQASIKMKWPQHRGCDQTHNGRNWG